MIRRYSSACAAAALAVGMCAPANAALDSTLGTRATVAGKPVSDCSARAKSALESVLHNSFEAGAGSGQWLAVERITPQSEPSASVTIECHAVDNGYAVSFTCAVEVPPNPDTAPSLCTKLVAAFNAQTASAGGAAWR